MAEVTRVEVYAYQQQAAKVESEAKRVFMDAISKIDVEKPEAQPVVEEIVTALYDRYGAASAELGRQFYQFCHDREVGDRATYLATSDFDYENTRGPLEDQIAYHLRMMQQGKHTLGETINSMSMTLGDYIQKANRAAILSNLGNEYEQLKSGRSGYSRYAQSKSEYYQGLKQRQASRPRGMRTARIGYARVPSPSCTCAFCITMASRGFVYWSDETAGGHDPANKYHDHCRCSIVRLDSNDPRIQGYSESEYLAQYEAARDALYTNDLPEEVYERIARAKEQAENNGKDFKMLNEVEIAMRYMYGMT